MEFQRVSLAFVDAQHWSFRQFRDLLWTFNFRKLNGCYSYAQDLVSLLATRPRRKYKEEEAKTAWKCLRSPWFKRDHSYGPLTLLLLAVYDPISILQRLKVELSHADVRF